LAKISAEKYDSKYGKSGNDNGWYKQLNTEAIRHVFSKYVIIIIFIFAFTLKLSRKLIIRPMLSVRINYMQLRYFAINFCYKHEKTASYIPKPLEDDVSSELSIDKLYLKETL
jgi:hypothetical protein